MANLPDADFQKNEPNKRIIAFVVVIFAALVIGWFVLNSLVPGALPRW